MLMDLFDWIFIISGIVFFSSIICVFILTANDKEDKVKIFGIILFIMIFPLISVLIKYSIVGDLRFIIFLILILSYLVIEFLLDQVFKIDFRSKLSRHIPYIIVEWTACFSFLFGALRLDYTWGWIVSFFFFAFIIALIYNIAKLKRKK
ncbi:MAG: hypothetical protein EAX91_01330 [Candidatus Lokiarchaeota archaeon]|nr:hypothetical protein [Candidatus Lokiarchaeota archaeon]